MTGTIKKQRLVIIGNGMASGACLEEILRLAPDRYEITVFGAERRVNYNRVLLPDILSGEKTFADITLHDPKWYVEKGVRLHTGCGITSIKRGGKAVVWGAGSEVGYDKLILSTGSVPFIPPIPGADLDGVVSFRDMDDCEKIREKLKEGGRAVIVGGGILGLEAAAGLVKLGMDVTVVHLMDRLMERQLDRVGAAFLKEDLEAQGIKVLLEKETVEITGSGRVEGIRFKDDGRIEADLVVFSVGIRPNVELARASGIYCERGVVVSDVMQTYDPAIFAIGECVQHRGATFGLVAPIFEQARVLADHLAGSSRLIFKNRPTSVRIKVPGIDLYSAGDMDERDAQPIEYLDRFARRYKKILIKDNVISGIVMYGNTSDGPELFSHLAEGRDISGLRHNIFFASRMSPDEDAVGALPDASIVCGCNGVTKGAITEAISKKGLFTREDVARETKASTSCGGCAGLVDKILEATLGSDFQGGVRDTAICPCTKYSRDDVIKNIREKRLKSVKDVMETLGWETVGCEKCRPAINYYVSMVWPESGQDDPSSRLVNERMHANIQKDGTFSVVPRMWGGATTPEELKKIADVAVKYGLPLVKITGGQRIALIGVKKDDLPGVWDEIGMPSGYAYGKALRTVKTCVGSAYCRYGTQDSLNLGIEIERRLNGLWMPAKLKMGVSGCPRNCAEAGIKDVGIVGVAGGFEVYAGGCGGIELKAGERLCTVNSGVEAIEVAEALIQFYREDAHYGERMFKWIKRAGFKSIRKAVVEDKENRTRLLALITEALKAVEEPWRRKKETA